MAFFRVLFFAAFCLLAHQPVSTVSFAQDQADWQALNPITEFSPLEVVKADGTVLSFDVEIRDDYQGRAMGMMYRPSLDPDKGMIFLFQRPGRQGFWMKNCVIPLDMLFVRSNGRIANIIANAPPGTEESRRSQGRVIAVLELAGGRAEELGIVPGDIVRHAGLGNLTVD